MHTQTIARQMMDTIIELKSRMSANEFRRIHLMQSYAISEAIVQGHEFTHLCDKRFSNSRSLENISA